MEKCKKHVNIIMQIKAQELAMETTKMRVSCLSTRERRGVRGIESFVSKCHLENPCAINGKQVPKWTSLLIFIYVVRRQLRNNS